MKKIINILLAGVAALGFVACQEDELTEYDSSKAVAPVLSSYSEAIALASDGEDVTLNFTAASYGVSVPVEYALYASVTSDFATESKIGSSTQSPATSIAAPQASLNNVLISAAMTPGEATTLYLRLKAMMKGESTTISGTELYSNVITLSVTPYNADKTYPVIYVIGNFNGWAHDDSQLYLYNFEEDDVTYQGVLNFGDAAANGWKIKGKYDSWVDDCNWGLDGDAATPQDEAGSVTLISAGSSQDIKIYSHKYYHFSFNRSTLTLTKNASFDKIGLVGIGGDWSSTAYEFSYDASTQRFYVDVDLSEATEGKVWVDEAWTLNYGGTYVSDGLDFDVTVNGANIAFPAGQYRVYLNMNDFGSVTMRLSTDDYGTEIGSGDDNDTPVAPTGYGIVGDFNSWGSGSDGSYTDVMMTETDGVYVGYITTTEASQGFKIRKDGAWSESYGGTLAELGTAFDAISENSANITVPEAGYYKVELDLANLKITVSVADTNADLWSIIGNGGDWDTDIFMTQTGTGLWVSDPIDITSAFKLRYNKGWTEDRGGTFASEGTPFAAVAGGDNISVTAGRYQVVYDPALETITVNPLTWSVIGVVEGTNWDWDLALSPLADGKFRSVPFIADGELKIRQSEGWDVNRGGTFAENGVAFDVTNGGSNIVPPTTGQAYVLTYDPSAETITLEKAWAVIGMVEGDSWTKDFYMTQTSDGVWETAVTINGEFKLRQSGDWNVNRGSTTGSVETLSDGAATSVANGGANLLIGATDKEYRVTYTASAETITVAPVE